MVNAGEQERVVEVRSSANIFQTLGVDAEIGRTLLNGDDNPGNPRVVVLMKFTIRPLTPDLWPALEDLFGKQGPVSRCWCMYWRIWQRLSQEVARCEQGRVL